MMCRTSILLEVPPPMTRPARLVLLLAAAALVAGCGGGGAASSSPPASATPAATAAPGSAVPTATPSAAPTAASTAAARETVLLVPAVGFAMALSDGWLVLPLDGDAAAIRALLPADSQLRGVLEGGLQPLLDAGLVGWAIDGSAGAGTITPNVNLLVREGIALPALDEMVAAVTDELAAVPGISAVDSQVVELVAGPAVRSTYLGLGEGAEARAQGIQYAIPSGGRLLVLSFTIPANDAAREAAVEAMAAAVELAP